MTRTTTAALAALLGIGLALAPAARLAAAEPDDEAKAIAEKALTAGAAFFDAKDVKGIAATYTDDAVLTLVTQEKDSSELKKDTRQGRAEIENGYRDLFKPDQTFHAKNVVEYARMAGPDLILIAGHFTPDTQAPEPLKLPFVQVRKKEGDAWKIINIQVFLVLGKN